MCINEEGVYMIYDMICVSMKKPNVFCALDCEGTHIHKYDTNTCNRTRYITKAYHILHTSCSILIYLRMYIYSHTCQRFILVSWNALLPTAFARCLSTPLVFSANLARCIISQHYSIHINTSISCAGTRSAMSWLIFVMSIMYMYVLISHRKV